MKYVVGVLTVLLVGLAYLFFDCQKKLGNCKEVPDFRNVIFNTKEFTGFAKTFRFKIECTAKDDPSDCTYKDMSEIALGQPTILKPERNERLGKSSYVTEWIENWKFYVDLSNSNDWEIEESKSTITFKCESIEINQIVPPGGILSYAADRSLWKNDEKQLLNIVTRYSEYSKIKSREYLEQNKAEVQDAMTKSISSFIEDLIGKLGIEQSYTILIEYK